MAHELNVDVKAVVASGPGLAFIAYPKAVELMPGSHVWAILFFAMITLLGLGTQFVCVEAFVTAVVDVFPKYLRYGRRREWFILTTCLVSYLIGLAMVTMVCPTTQCPIITMLTDCARVVFTYSICSTFTALRDCRCCGSVSSRRLSSDGYTVRQSL